MDDADRATDLEEARMTAAMAQIAKVMTTVNPAQECDSVLDSCDGFIGEARKKAVPSATRCTACQTEFDKLFKGVKRL